ncbi:MAG: isocitrate lyase/phosphoenolpyruvate mutase family protein [Bacteroidota bacterium]
MNTKQKFNLFERLHIPGNPIILYNIWDAGSAKIVAEAGAKAVATGSHPLASAQGYDDGEIIPFDRLLAIVEQIVNTVQVPVSVDFEGGYAKRDNELLAKNISKLLEAGVIGVNFEDQHVGEDTLFDIKAQMERIAILRNISNRMDSPLFINARTDLFLKEKVNGKHATLVSEAKERAQAFEEAGANSFFVPGLYDPDLIGEICQHVSLPVNVIKTPTAPDHSELAKLGVGRISYGPYAYRALMDTFRDKVANVHS